MNICIVEAEHTQQIKPLWEKLNDVHLAKSVHFKQKYETFTFEKRMEAIYKKAKKGKIKLDLLMNRDTDAVVGYCLSSIEDDQGEIESIFIEDSYRKQGLGKRLMESALNWFDLNQITDLAISVVYANDDALPFYEQFGFRIAAYNLKRRKNINIKTT